MIEEKKDVVTYVDGVKYTMCYYRGPKELSQQEHTNKSKYSRVKKVVDDSSMVNEIISSIDEIDE